MMRISSWNFPKAAIWGFSKLFGGDQSQLKVADEDEQANIVNDGNYPFTVITVKELGPKSSAFSRVIGTERQQEELNMFAAPLIFPNWDDYQKQACYKPERKPMFLILHGKPGSGKTMHARGMACFLGIPMIVMKASNLGHLNAEGMSPFQRAMELASKQLKSAMILIDEVDALPDSQRSLAEVRQAIDGVHLLEEGCSIIVVGTTNRSLQYLPLDFVQRATRTIAFDWFGSDETSMIRLLDFWQKNARRAFPRPVKDGELVSNEKRGENGKAYIVPVEGERLQIIKARQSLKGISAKTTCREGCLIWLRSYCGCFGTHFVFHSLKIKGTELVYIVHDKGAPHMLYEVSRDKVKESIPGIKTKAVVVHCDENTNACDIDMEPTIVHLRSKDDYEAMAKLSTNLPQRKLVQVAQQVLHEHITQISAKSPGKKVPWPLPKDSQDPPLELYEKLLKRAQQEQAEFQQADAKRVMRTNSKQVKSQQADPQCATSANSEEAEFKILEAARKSAALDIAAVQAELEELKRRHVDLQSELSAQKAANSAAATAFKASDAAKVAVEAQFSELEKQHGDLRSELSKQKARAVVSEDAKVDAEAQLAELEKQHGDLRLELSKQKARAVASEDAKAVAEAQLSELEKQRSDLRSELSKQKARAVASEDAKAELEAQLLELEKQHGDLKLSMAVKTDAEALAQFGKKETDLKLAEALEAFEAARSSDAPCPLDIADLQAQLAESQKQCNDLKSKLSVYTDSQCTTRANSQQATFQQADSRHASWSNNGLAEFQQAVSQSVTSTSSEQAYFKQAHSTHAAKGSSSSHHWH